MENEASGLPLGTPVCEYGDVPKLSRRPDRKAREAANSLSLGCARQRPGRGASAIEYYRIYEQGVLQMNILINHNMHFCKLLPDPIVEKDGGRQRHRRPLANLNNDETYRQGTRCAPTLTYIRISGLND